MSESEKSQSQDDSDEDIYKDILEFNFEDELAKLEGSKETYRQEASDLSERIKALAEENKDLKKSNEVLKKNLSTLLKTAQAEVQRKDSMIDELRTKVDSFAFRRNKTQAKDKYTSTDDLIIYSEAKYELEKQKSYGDKKRLAFLENWTSSDSEQKFNQDEKRKEFSTERKNSSCDNVKKSGEQSRTKSRHSGTSRNSQDDRLRDRKSSRYEDSSSYRRSYRENHRDHLRHDSYDKKRHSRSSDRRYLCGRKNSRERRDNRKKDHSSERRRSRESAERSERKNSRRRRSHSRGSRDSLEKPKTRSSLKNSDIRIKEQNNTKLEILDSVGNIGMLENKNRNNVEKQNNQENESSNSKSKQNKEKRSDADIFSARSPLDALYNDMITCRNANRFSNPKSVTGLLESDIEEGELPVMQPVEKFQNTPESQPEEDWTLSFKNERQKETKPLTLYSRRMMRKFSSESKSTERLENEEKKALREENDKVKKMEVVEKEPGELTDDENIVESSKEFQELTKVASVDNEIMGAPMKKKTFKDPIEGEFSETENVKSETKENQKEIEKPTSGRDEFNAYKNVEQNKETREMIEFSPFKNNYKLIEISPIKPPSGEHVLDFYNKKASHSAQIPEPNVSSLSEGCNKSSDISEGKELWKNSSSEKDSETELKIVIPEKEKSLEIKKESRQDTKKVDDKKLKDCKKENTLGRGKRKSTLKKNVEKQVVDDKSKKKKRKLSKSEEHSVPKKRKVEKNESSRKSKRVKRNSKSEPESECEKKVKEDISSFEFFKPIAKAETPQTPLDPEKPISTTTDYKMTATMSVTGVVRLETPNKCVEKLKNLMINEQMIFNVLDSKSNSQLSPFIGSKCIEMTPRRMLKNDLMLTDSEDDSVIKKNNTESDEAEQEEVEEEDQISGIENSECGSDSGASDFVDLL